MKNQYVDIKKLKFWVCYSFFLPFLIQCEFLEHPILFPFQAVQLEVAGYSFQIGQPQQQVQPTRRVNPRAARVQKKKPVQMASLAPTPQQKPVYGECQVLAEQKSAEIKRAQFRVEQIVLSRNGKNQTTVTLDKTLNLLTLAPEISKALSAMDIPAGLYNEIRLVGKSALAVDRFGKKSSLSLPQGILLKLSRDLEVPEESTRLSVSLNFCTETNFERQDNQSIAFHPEIEKVINLSI